MHSACTQDSAAKVDDKKGTHGQRRMDVKNLSQEQKDLIANMATPADMSTEERKRQYSALRRAVVKSCSAPLLAKFQLCSDSERSGVGKPWTTCLTRVCTC